MGRKKRKVAAADEADGAVAVAVAVAVAPDAAASVLPPPPPPQLKPMDPRARAKAAVGAVKTEPVETSVATVTATTTGAKEGEKEAVKASHYAMQSHGGEIVGADVYVSSGSEDEEDHVDIVLSGAKMGLMRRGLLHQTMLVQPNLRQWTKPEVAEGEAVDETEEQQRLKEEEELSKLDPAERAARLLVEKQRKLEEAKVSARRLESEENAGRDPCLFSKRTAFDIRFDQIDDKPWERGAGEMTDFFNYSMTVEDWLEYAQQQLTVRQELTDASRQKRPPDPNIVPVSGKKPKSQTPKVAVDGGEEAVDGENTPGEDDMEESGVDAPVIGPALVVKKEGSDDDDDDNKADDPMDTSDYDANKDVYAGAAGGAWGAGAAPDSVLARLIEEQTGGGGGNKSAQNAPPPPPPPRNEIHYGDNSRSGGNSHDDSSGHYGASGVGQYGSQNQNQYAPQNQNQNQYAPPGQYGASGDSYDGRGNGGYEVNAPDQAQGDYRQRNYQGRGGGRGFDDGGRGGGRGRFNSYGGGGGRGSRGDYAENNTDGGDAYGGGGRGRGRGRGRGGRFNSGGRGPPQGGRYGGRGGGGRGDHYGGGGSSGSGGRGNYYQR